MDDVSTIDDAVETPEDGSRVPVTLPIRVTGLDDLEARLTNWVAANFDGAIFQLVFGQFMEPLIMGPDDPAHLAEQGHVPVRPVARLALTPETMVQVIELLQGQLDRAGIRRPDVLAAERGKEDNVGQPTH